MLPKTAQINKKYLHFIFGASFGSEMVYTDWNLALLNKLA